MNDLQLEKLKNILVEIIVSIGDGSLTGVQKQEWLIKRIEDLSMSN